MTVTTLSWYLCVLFAVALIVSSAISVAPGGEWWMALEMVTLLALSVLFAAVAVAFRVFRLSQPKWLLRTFQCLAVLATLVVALTVVG